MDSRFNQRISETLHQLAATGNFRSFPSDSDDNLIDLSSNDYLGLAERADLREAFFADNDTRQLAMTSSASRLLASMQSPYRSLEKSLSRLYDGRPALLFNSGYHANTGIIQAIASPKTVILADRLVHASIIDGIRLSGARFTRFRHNDYGHLDALLASQPSDAEIIIIAEGVYSMDGDAADIDRLIEIKRSRQGQILLYIDEAHSFGVCGKSGLGLVASSISPSEVDIVVGTLGKAAASVGAFAVTTPLIHDYLVNKARSLIFSTALPPINVAWSDKIVNLIPSLDFERERLTRLSRILSDAVASPVPSHIMPYIIGDAEATLQLSSTLRAEGVKVLPIRTPTVPPGTERLRISVSAALTDSQVEHAARLLNIIASCR